MLDSSLFKISISALILVDTCRKISSSRFSAAYLKFTLSNLVVSFEILVNNSDFFMLFSFSM
ncbi:hypothetical protein BTO04_10915 [Polaribacter sp. SA4-10]|nr:hypothetical protein BTO04_10915 [Polaribacter sp. SA4-10]